MTLTRCILLAALAGVLPALAHAQWQWIDNSGRKVFSDQAPPPDIPAKNILRQPGGRPAAAPAAAAPPTADAPAANAAAPAATGTATAAARPASGALKVSGKDKELEEKKKQADAAEAAKKKAEEEKIAKQRAENCARAKQGKATYESGQRIARMNDKGEREILDDAQRAAEVKRLNEIIAIDCKAG